MGRLGVVFAVGEPGGPWVRVDTGLHGSTGLIGRALVRRFGAGPKTSCRSAGSFRPSCATVVYPGVRISTQSWKSFGPLRSGPAGAAPSTASMAGASSRVDASIR